MSTNQQNLLEIEPLRNLNFWHIWALGVGAVVGDGIFLLLGQAVEVAGPSAILSIFIAGVLELFLQLTLSELAVGMPSAGALDKWSERFLGEWWGYLAGMSWAIAWTLISISVCIAMGRFLAYFIPINELVLAAICVTIFWLLNVRGALVAATTQLWMVIGLVAIMVGLAIFGAPHAVKGFPQNFLPFTPNGLQAMFLAVPMASYAFMGTACLCTSGSECKNIRDLPKALVWAAITFIVVYTLSLVVMIGSIDWRTMSLAESLYVTFAQRIFGTGGAAIVTVAACLATATCTLMGTFYGSSRIFYEEARNGKWPKIFGELHPKYRTPTKGLFIIWLVNIVGIGLATFNVDSVYVFITMLFLCACYITYGLSIISAILYRQRCPDEVKKLPFRIPVPWLTFPIAIVGLGICVYFAALDNPGLIYGLIGLVAPLYLYYSIAVKNRKSDASVPS
ncbi:MAG: amino acid permease [Acholeplasmataceae bacterium]|nr:amino acid permease [Acholeplasmataceae bacterium]